MVTLSNQQQQHLDVIKQTLQEVNKESSSFVLKGGTALMMAYGLDRFSEDIDFDARSSQNILSVLTRFADKKHMPYRIAKNTETVKRLFLNYDPQSLKHLKIETSYRMRQLIRDDMVTKINGILTYKIPYLFETKVNAFSGRDALRDIYDVCFIYNHFKEELFPQDLLSFSQLLADSGANKVMTILSTQTDELIDNDKLLEDYIQMVDDIGIVYSDEEFPDIKPDKKKNRDDRER